MLKATQTAVALLAEGVDRNMRCVNTITPSMSSPSSRRAWIEMVTTGAGQQQGHVALLAEGVDRNWTSCPASSNCRVALLAEGVDRNLSMRTRCTRTLVALLAEGVDRNWQRGEALDYTNTSPSSRRAWIEIRNTSRYLVPPRSPSSRRAWIEIGKAGRDLPRAARRPPRGGRG